MEKKLCPKGKAYYNRRRAAGEKPSAYLSGRAVKVCKGLMEEGLTIPETFYFVQTQSKKSTDMILELIKNLQEENKKLKNENIVLKQISEKNEKDLSRIKNFLEEKLDFKNF